MIDKVTGGRYCRAVGVGLSGVTERLVTIGNEVRNGDCSQNSDNRDNDHQFDQGKTFFVSQFLDHDFSPFFLFFVLDMGLTNTLFCTFTYANHVPF
jgi:hypothetical protein